MPIGGSGKNVSLILYPDAIVEWQGERKKSGQGAFAFTGN
jgi:hypothetical protein